MSRPATGQVIERKGKRGRTFALRFRAYGRREFLTLGSAERDERCEACRADEDCAHHGWTRQRAELELQNVLADVRRGFWRSSEPASAEEEAAVDPTFLEFASQWVAAREAEGLAAKTIRDLRWSLELHLIDFFGRHRLSEITPQLVDAYKVEKARERAAIEKAREEARRQGERYSERGLSNESINHTLRHLAQILEVAVEYGLLAANPASGKRRRLKAKKPARPWVEPEQLPALLDATSGVGRVLLAVLAGGGLRIGEALALRWQHVDLGTGTLYVVDAKTDKGIREVHLTPALREDLILWRADSDFTGPADFVVTTATGRRHNPSNLRRDVLARAIERANATLAEDGIAPIGRVTFHSLRRTYASLRCACGDDVRYTADQLGHEDPRFTLKVYAQATKRRERLSGPHLRAYDRALEWARMGTSAQSAGAVLQMEATENPA